MAKRKQPIVLKHPNRVEQGYFAELNRWVAGVNQLARELIKPELEGWVRDGRFRLRGDRMDNRQDIDRIFRRLDQYTEDVFGVGWADGIAFETAETVNQFNQDKNARSVRRVLGIDVVRAEPWLADRVQAFVSDNVDLIQSLQREHLRKLKLQTVQVVEKGITNAEFARQIESEFGTVLQKTTSNARARAKLIARDQIAKFNGKLTETRQTAAGFKKYRWVTSGDERVRETHRMKNGQVFEWSNPPADTGHPGEDYQCRCYAEPIMTPDVETDVPLRQLFNR